MSSLRPLATITLLAAVGVFLYMKINETEPALPPGLGEWTLESPEIGGDFTTSDPIATSPAAPATDEAPSFQASAATSAAPAAGAAASADAAPPWTPGVAANSAPAAAAPKPAAKPNEKSSPIARTAEPATTVPPIPPLPATNATPAPAANASASTAPAAAAAAAVAAGAATGDKPSAPTTEAAPFNPLANAPAAASAAAPSTPSDPTTPASPIAESPKTPDDGYSAARVAVQSALDRGQLAQALLLLSDWYGDPSLTPQESQEVESLLSQLAGSVIYEGPPAHRLEKPYIVQAGETLDAIAAKYSVPPQLLAKINGVSQGAALTPGQELKVLRGPFSAVIELGKRKMTLMLDRRYAGQFTIEIDPTSTIEEGQWKVDQKLLTPANPGLYAQTPAATEDRSLLLANPTSPTGQAAILRGPGAADALSAEPRGRVIRLKAGDVNDVYDILSEGSRVTIRR